MDPSASRDQLPQKCPVCEEINYRLLYPAVPGKANPSSLYFEVGHGPIVQCQVCGMIFACPQPEELNEESEYGLAEVQEYMSELTSRKQTFAAGLDLVERFVRQGKILDVGCLTGIFLDVARQRGWQVAGLDPSAAACATAQTYFGLEVWQGVLPDPRITVESFDVVTLWDVIEHVSDPGALVRECWQALRPGGLLVLGTPDIGSLLARIMGGRWMWIVRVHLHYFSRDTISRLLENADFKVKHIQSQSRYFTFGHMVYRLGGYAPALARILELLRLLPGLRTLLVPVNLFDTMIVVAERKSD